MDEHVLAAIFAGDEPEPLGVVEPLHLSGDRHRGRRIRGDPARRGPSRNPSPAGLCGRSTTPAASTSSTRVTCAPLAPAPTWTRNLAPAGTVSWPAACSALACRNASPAPPANSTNPYPLSALNHLTTASTGGAQNHRRGPSHGRPTKTASFRTTAEASTRPRPRLVRHRPIVVESALARRPKILTLAHISPRSPPKARSIGGQPRPSRSAGPSANSDATFRLNNLLRLKARSACPSTNSKAEPLSRQTRTRNDMERSDAQRSANTPPPPAYRVKCSARIIKSPLGRENTRTLRAEDSVFLIPLPDGPRERVNYLFI